MTGSAVPDVIVHDGGDTVGVVVVEDVEPGKALRVWVMDNNETVTVEALDQIPLGHKIALDDIAESDTVIKYGHDIGAAVAAVRRGGHVHVHNLKTKRW